MTNPTTAIIPNQINTPNVPPLTTGSGVLLIPANPARNGLWVWNISANTVIFGPALPISIAGVQVGNTFDLASGSWIFFGGIPIIGTAAILPVSPVFFWTWTQAMYAQAVSGATNAVTVLEF